jgi:transcriptional regulator with XRE-family HTH domain
MSAATTKELGDMVRAARRRRHMTQQQLAEHAGVSRKWVLLLEQGRVNPTWDVVARLAAVLDLDVVVRHAPAVTSHGGAAHLSGEGRLSVGGPVDLDAVLASHRETAAPVTTASNAPVGDGGPGRPSGRRS